MLDGRSARGGNKKPMNQMFEVYNNYSNKYDELVNHEDYKSNLKSFLNDKISWKDKTICEFGVGTGRVTKIYIDKVKNATLLDNSQHMLERAKMNLSQWTNKICFTDFDNKNIHLLENSFDLIIEGWSFGHLIVNEKDNVDYWIEILINESIKKANEKVIFIETMGTNVASPKAPGNILPYFYNKLKERGFEDRIIETDYEFSSCLEASRIMGSFFGESMKEDIMNRQLTIINEFTGIWIFNK